jgi:hypothetical protein
MALSISLLKIKGLIDSLVDYARDDLKLCIDEDRETESFLYLVLDGNNSDGYDFYKQAKSVFSRTEESSTKIVTGLAYPKDVSSAPYIWIREPQRTKGQQNGIGKLTGRTLDFVKEIYDPVEDVTTFENSFRQEYRDDKQAVYEVVIMSKNYIESIMVSEVIYSLLIGSYELLSTLFNLTEINMKELMMNNDNIPPFMIVSRAITLDVDFENFVPSVSSRELVNKLKFNGIPVKF